MLDPFMPCPMHGSKSFTPSSMILVLTLVAGVKKKQRQSNLAASVHSPSQWIFNKPSIARLSFPTR